MYPAVKDMDAVHSGTGVFYQAMPAVGADGKNIMKLIPVQMVDGQFFVQSQTSKPKTDPRPQKATSVNVPSAPAQTVKKVLLNPSDTQQIVRKHLSLMDALPNHVDSDLGSSPNKPPLQQQTVKLPVTVKSPALPRGHYLQIPPHAQVRTVPASELPAGIKRQIFTSSASSSPVSGLPSVVYVSPVTTVSQGVAPPGDPTRLSLKMLSKTPTSCGSKAHLKLIPKVSQRSNSPIKWVIEEEDISTAPAPCPINSPSVTSEILRAVAERENAPQHCSQGEGGQGQENALVMCNGKVFFVAKKCSLSLNVGKSKSPTAAAKSYECNKTIVPSSRHSPESAAPQLKQDLRSITPGESSEVIDLCDDDTQEDNVIFVSYIPPKSESGSTQELILKTETAPVKETQWTGTSSSNSATEQGEGRQDTSALRGRTPVQSVLVGTSTQQLESMEGDVETGSPADPGSSSNGTRSPTQQDAHRMESSMDPATSSSSRQMDDRLLRQIFGITADVKVCVQRIDEASAGCVPAEPPQRESTRSEEDQQEPKSAFKEREHFPQDRHRPHETDSYRGLINVKRVKLQEQELPAEPPTPGPHTGTGPLKCSHFKLNTKPHSALKNKCHSGQSSLKGISCDAETGPVIGYVEPIDEDFLSADENDIPNSQTQTCVDLSTNTRRVGRKRKRTTCPCCIPGTQDRAGRSSTKPAEPERKWACTAEQTSKKGGTDVNTPGRISCLRAKNKQNCETHEVPASGSLTPSDSDEVTRCDQINRLRQLLKEKETALELMRSTS